MTSEAEAVGSKTRADANQPSSNPSNSQPPVSRPSVTIQSGSHLDPGAYVRGSFPITIGQNVLIHPRAHLLSIHSPLFIGDGCVISEKCVLGGPLPVTNQSDRAVDATETGDEVEHDEDHSAKATVVDNMVHLHPNVTVNHGATINSGSVIESNTIIESNIMIGSYSKICSTLVISENVPDWTVVWGTTTNMKRRCKATQFDSKQQAHKALEDERIKAMQREREGTIVVLRNATSKPLGSSSRSKK